MRADVGVCSRQLFVYNDGKREPGITSTQAGVPATHVMKVSRARHILTNQINNQIINQLQINHSVQCHILTNQLQIDNSIKKVAY